MLLDQCLVTGLNLKHISRNIHVMDEYFFFLAKRLFENSTENKKKMFEQFRSIQRLQFLSANHRPT